MTHVENSSVTRETDAMIQIEGEPSQQRALIASLTPQGLVLRPKGKTEKASKTIPFGEIWGEKASADEANFDNGYAVGMSDCLDHLISGLKKKRDLLKLFS